MAESSGNPPIGPLYVKMTEPRVDGSAFLAGARDIFGELSITSQFKVCLHLVNSFTGDDLNKWLLQSGITSDMGRNAEYDFFCAEAMLPGATFDITEEVGSHQGIIERFPTKRIYPEFNITLYVDNDYEVIRLFEEWMNYINPIYSKEKISTATINGQGNFKARDQYFRLRYPDSYKRIVSIAKFERNFLDNPNKNQAPKSVPTFTYRMIDAFPTNITSIPVSYEGSTITKTTVQFSYSRYVIEKSKGTIRPRRTISTI